MGKICINIKSPALKIEKLVSLVSYINIYYGYDNETCNEDEIEICGDSKWEDDSPDSYDRAKVYITFDDVSLAIDILSDVVNISDSLDNEDERELMLIREENIRTLIRYIMLYYKQYNISNEWPTDKLIELFHSKSYMCGWADEASL